MNKKKPALTVLSMLALAVGVSAPSLGFAADINWSGYYRFEGVDIHGAELNSNASETSYMLHHLVLSPKITAADGLTIYSRFDVFNNINYGQNNQFGEFFGSGPRNDFSSGSVPATPAGQSTHSKNSNVLSRAQAAGSIAVSSLYAVWNQEFGSLIVGRVPIEFGLGVVHSAGNGIFDHWFESKDIIGYKVVMGSLFVLPMIGKVSEGDVGYEDDVNDYMVQVGYDNPESDLSGGVFFEERITTRAGNDMPVTGPSALGTTQSGGFKTQLFSLFLKRKISQFTIGVEGDFVTGDAGVTNALGQSVSMNSFAVATEFDYRPLDSRWHTGLKMGFASGDDPSTTNVYEGFVFNRNYDVAFLLFNHPLGQYDVLRTGLVRDVSVTASSQPDTEALSNVIYFAPNLDYKLKDNLWLNGTFAYAMLNKDPSPTGAAGKDLGYELDLGVTYKPYDRLTWKTQSGLLIPGKAWVGGPASYENKVAYGFETKAAISF